MRDSRGSRRAEWRGVGLVVLGLALVACGPADEPDSVELLDVGLDAAADVGADTLGSGPDTSDAGPEQPPDADPTECSPGDEQGRSCGVNDDGTQLRRCSSDGEWEPWGACQGGGECKDAEESKRSCAGGGEQTRTCVDGGWSDWSECTSKWTSLSATDGHFCAINEAGDATCFGDWRRPYRFDGPYQQAVMPSTRVFCGVKEDGSLSCESRSKGTDYSDHSVITDAPSGSFEKVDVTIIAHGRGYACGLRPSGELICWGEHAVLESARSLSGTFRDFDIRDGYMCAVRSSGDIVCRGPKSRLRESIPGTGFVELAIGEDHLCALDSSDNITCEPTVEPSDDPYRDDGDTYGQHENFSSPARQVDVGLLHNCALADDGTISCWGDNDDYESVDPDGQFVDVAAIEDASCGLRADGTLHCWGEKGISCGLADQVALLDGPNDCDTCGRLPASPGQSCTCSGTFECSEGRPHGTCDDGDNDIGSADVQKATDDGVDGWTKRTSTLAERDEDWYSIEVDDGTFGRLEPEVKVSSSAYNKITACLYYERDSGTQKGIDCRYASGFDMRCTEVTHNGKKLEGRCLDLILRKHGSGQKSYARHLGLDVPDEGDDSGTAYIQVKSFDTTPACRPYAIQYRF